MSQPKLDENGEFLVKDSKSINLLIGVIMIAIFFISQFVGDYGWSNFLMGTGLFLVPGAVAISRARRNTVIMRINKTGFYYGTQLIAGWDLFYDARVHDRMGVGNFRDNFVLDFRYYSEDRALIYTRSIPLTNTQDKAEEEVIQAIQFFCDAGRSVEPALKQDNLHQ
ncbi:MAG TPA: hypothetical protein VFR58_17165 [Flavisolibacter sp.]|nr:hypothetical protein [Flavisolibacter sp.]